MVLFWPLLINLEIFEKIFKKSMSIVFENVAKKFKH